MNYFSDDAILNGLKEKRADSIRYLYREYFPLAKSIVEKNSGSYQDAEDVFQDGIIVLYQKILSGTAFSSEIFFLPFFSTSLWIGLFGYPAVTPHEKNIYNS